jgi:hypothetical protein
MLTKLFGSLDWRHWLLSHVVWIVAIGVAIVIGRSYIAEHDARLLADAQIKISETTISDLRKQMAANNAAAAQKVQTIVKIVHDAKTPEQQLAAVPQLSDVPLNARIVPSLSGPAQVAVDLAPLVQELGQCKQDAVKLEACQTNLKVETVISQKKDEQIIALKKKPSLWARITSHGKAAAIGIVVFEVVKIALTKQI